MLELFSFYYSISYTLWDQLFSHKQQEFDNPSTTNKQTNKQTCLSKIEHKHKATIKQMKIE
jgi:Skp family chaperone for outer membrane proteins